MRDRQNEEREEDERRREARNGEDAEWRSGEDAMEGELRWIANFSSHINKREDTVCEAAEKPPSLQLPRRAGRPGSLGLGEDSRNLLKIHRPAPNGAFGWAAGR